MQWVVLFVMAITLLVVPSTHADSKTNTANTLKVSPVRTDIEIKAGETKTVQTTITNLTGGPISVSPIENDFIAGDERGTPALILDANQYAPTHSLKRFMQPLTNVTIPANQSKTVNVTIVVPKTAQAGGYFGAIRYAPTTPDGGQQVNLSASVASLILMTVPGPTTEKVELTKFDITQNGKAGENYFSSSDSMQATFRFMNKGNVQEGPFGKVAVKQGDKVIYSADFNTKTPRDMILPDSARIWDVPLKNIGNFGHYTVLATFTYGKSNQTIQVEKSFWIIPIQFIIAAVVGVVLLIALIVGIFLGLRSYKRRILRNNRGFRR